MITADELISKLRIALQRDGDFPVSAKIVSELRQLTSDPKTTAEQITELILREPSLGTRVLHFVNSAFMRRAKPILTVSQAVVQIGMKPLADLCAGLVLLQKFVPASRRSAPFAQCLKRAVVTSLLSSNLSQTIARDPKRSSKGDEAGYLLGQFAELGTLLLAFYFPEILEAAARRSEQKGQEISQSISDITGLTPWRLSIEVIEALQLPEYFKKILESAEQVSKGGQATVPADTAVVAKSVFAARELGGAIAEGKSKAEVDAKLAKVNKELGIDISKAHKVLADLPRIFKDHCTSVELELAALPEFMATYSDDPDSAPSEPSQPASAEFGAFVAEVRQMVENREPTASIITSVMETMAYGLRFDRVFLLLMAPNRTKLLGRMLLGSVAGFDPKRFEILTADNSPHSPALKAFKEGRPVFKGQPVFKGGWPLCAIPVGFGTRAIGVIYADKVPPEGSTGEDLSSKDQASITILAELLERSITIQARGI